MNTFEFDSLTVANLLNQALKTDSAQTAIEVRVVNTSSTAEQNVSISLNVDALGDESIYGFSLKYDRSRLTNPVVSIGTAGGSVRANTAQPGKIGISVSFGGNAIAAGSNQQLIIIQFKVVPGTEAGLTPLGFTEQPAFREVASSPSYTGDIRALPTIFTDDEITIIQSTNKIRKRAKFF